MRLEYYDSEKLKRELKEIMGKYLDLSRYAVFFFGSRVTGTGDDRSDIDIGIEGDTSVPRVAMGRIREDVEELRVLYKIDLVDFKNVSQKFYDFAKKDIEYITNGPIRV